MSLFELLGLPEELVLDILVRAGAESLSAVCAVCKKDRDYIRARQHLLPKTW